MHIGKKYGLLEALVWTRRDIAMLLVIAAIPTTLYELLALKWLCFPWLPMALIGSAVAFLIGFKNNASYDRMWEARRAWGSIINFSRSWGILVRDYIHTAPTAKGANADLKAIHRTLTYRHFAWLTALRFQLRESRPWEGMSKKNNQEYRKRFFAVSEIDSKLEDELPLYLSKEEYEYVCSKKNKAAHIISLQSLHLQQLVADGYLEGFHRLELAKILTEFYNMQGICERIKNTPYPRQYATMNFYFVWLFILLLPFGMLQEFEKLGAHLVWLNIPFSAVVSWVFTTMEKIGESTENPFEGNANDIPITAMSRNIEIDLRELLDEAPNTIPPPISSVNNLLL